MGTRLHIFVSDELLERVDRLRGREPRSSFIRAAVEAFVADQPVTPVEGERRKRSVPSVASTWRR